jgi:hypothetical protein
MLSIAHVQAHEVVLSILGRGLLQLFAQPDQTEARTAAGRAACAQLESALQGVPVRMRAFTTKYAQHFLTPKT